MLQKERLYDTIYKILNENVDNINMVKTLNRKFAEKGLDLKVIQILLAELKDISDVNDVQIMAIAEGLHELFPNNNDLDLSKYFSAQEIISYESYMNIEEKVNELTFDNTIRINNFDFMCICSFEKLAKYFNSNLITYNKQTQRQSEYIKLGKDYIRRISVNQKAINDMAKDILNNNFENTANIVLNVRLRKDNQPRLNYEDGTLRIAPNYDIHSRYFTSVEVIDGYHKLLAIVKADMEYYNLYNKHLQNTISVMIIQADVKRATQIVRNTFKRSDTDIRFLKSIEQTDYTRFVDLVESQSRALNGKLATSYEEFKALHKLSYKYIFVETIKRIGVEVNNQSVVLIQSRDIANMFDTLFDIINENNKELINLLYNCNIYIIILKYFFEIINKNDANIEDFYKIINKLSKIDNKIIKELKLNNKNYSFNQIFNY